MRKLIVGLAALLFVGIAVPAQADSFTPQQQEELQKLVRDYLISHPEILRDMANALEVKDKQVAAENQKNTLGKSSAEIFRDGTDAVVGNPKGDVTVVEFMDYNCGWCRKSVGEMQALLKKDPNVRIVMKEFPIFGEGSEYAAKAALASVKQGKYWELHQALFATEGKITPETTDAAAKKVGLDMKKLKADMANPELAQKLAKNTQLAQALQFTGTPGFLIGDKVYPGYIPFDEIMAGVTAIRANGGCKVC